MAKEELKTIKDLINGHGEEYILFAKHKGKYKKHTSADTFDNLLKRLKEIDNKINMK